MGEGLNWVRKTIAVSLTFLIAFLGTMAAVAAATKPESSTWMPLVLGFVFYMALGLLKPFKEVTLRLAVTALFASGALSLWFISEPPAASEPNQRFNEYVLVMCSVGPFLCTMLLALLFEERRKVPGRATALMLVLMVLGWSISYFSEWHTLSGLHHMAAAGIRFASEIGSGHSLPHRRILQVGFYVLSTVVAWGLARTSGAELGRRLLVCVLVVGSFVLFDVTRIPFELALPVSKGNFFIDTLAAAAAFGACELVGRARRAHATT